MRLWTLAQLGVRKQRCSQQLGGFRQLHPNLFVGRSVFTLRTFCHSFYRSFCGSFCFSPRRAVSLMVVRDSAGLAFSTSLRQAYVSALRPCSRRARVVSSWLVVGLPYSRGTSRFRTTRFARAWTGCRDGRTRHAYPRPGERSGLPIPRLEIPHGLCSDRAPPPPRHRRTRL